MARSPVARPLPAAALPETRFEPSAPPPGVERRVAMFRALAERVPYDVPLRDEEGKVEVMPRSRPPRPWEDKRDNVEPVITARVPLSQYLGTTLGARGLAAFQMWASTRHSALWETPLGQSLATFALHRYGAAYQRPDKLGHGIAVCYAADRLAQEQLARGGRMTPEWDRRREFAALLHDIGYMNGGFMHSGKGGLDLLFNLPVHLARSGVSMSRDEVEKLACLVELHGCAFPWESLDERIAGDHYVDLALVQRLMTSPERRKALKDALRKENAPYLQAVPDGMRWLEDDAELDGLIAAGWVIHSADNFNGHKTPLLVGNEPERKRLGCCDVGRELPIGTFGQLDAFDEVRRAEAEAAAAKKKK